LLGSFVLNYIPVLDENPVFDAENVGCNPVHREASPGAGTAGGK
jgi:hypothetical protein